MFFPSLGLSFSHGRYNYIALTTFSTYTYQHIHHDQQIKDKSASDVNIPLIVNKCDDDLHMLAWYEQITCSEADQIQRDTLIPAITTKVKYRRMVYLNSTVDFVYNFSTYT